MRKLVFLSCLTVGLSAGFLACAGDDTPPAAVTDSGIDTGTDTGTKDTGTDTGTTDAGKDSAGTDGGADVYAGPQPINGCTVFVDLTAADAGQPTITGPAGGAVAAQYSPNCVKIKVGQSVTWNSGFATHPLGASGGDSPSPIATTSTGTTVSFSFPNAGTYGFACGIHPLSMFGAVLVVP
jgi:plastocyanin